MNRQTTHKITSVAIVALMTLMLFPIANAEDVRVGDAQANALEGAFGDGAPFGAVGKMLEEVDLYMHSEPIVADGTEYVTKAVESIVGGAAPETDPTYKQLSNAYADFAPPAATLTSLYGVVPGDPSGTFAPPSEATAVARIGDDPQDPANKRVRIGYLDPAGYAPDVNPTGGVLIDPVPDPSVTGVDFYQSVSWYTSPELTAEADFRIYDLKVNAFARCAVPGNHLDEVDDNSFGDLITNVYRVDADGNRIHTNADGVHVPIMTVYSSQSSTSATRTSPDTFTGSWLETNPTDLDSLGLNSKRAVPNFFLDEGILVKQGEGLEFEFGLDYATSFWINTADGEGIIFGGTEQDDSRQPLGPTDVECFLHYDTKDLGTQPGYPDPDNVYEYVSGDPAALPIQSVQNPYFGYPTAVTIIADSLRVSTWMSDSNGRLAVGLGNGDSFNVDTAFMSAWGSLARADYYANQPDVLDQRTNARFRYSDTQEVIDDFVSTSESTVTVNSDSILAIRKGYTFAQDTKRLAPFNTEVFLDKSLKLRDQEFKGLKIAQSASVFIGKTGMNFFVAEDETTTHFVNPGEPTIFTYTVENLGSSLDTITIAMDPIGGGWEGEILGSRQTVGGGGSATVGVLVTPPAGLTSGTSPAISVKAISSFSDIIPIQVAEPVRVTITDTESTGVAINAASLGVNLAPSESRFVGLNVRNLGTAEENFLLSFDRPDSASGWNIKLAPSGGSIYAGARDDFLLSIQAPADAPAEFEFPITVRVVRVGDASVVDQVVINVKVVGEFALNVVPFPPERGLTLRQKGANYEEGPVQGTYNPRDVFGELVDTLQENDPSGFAPGSGTVPGETNYCYGVPSAAADGAGGQGLAIPEGMVCRSTEQDVHYSGTTYFPILLENKGSLDDTYLLKRSPTTLSGWRYRVLDADGDQLFGYTNNGNVPMSIDMPAGASKFIYFELDPNAGGNSPESTFGSTSLSLSVDSKEKNGLTSGAFSFTVDSVGAGTQLGKTSWSGESKAVAARLQPGQADALRTLPGSPAEYLVRAQNLGNEADTLVIRGNLLPAGWTQSIEHVSSPFAQCVDETPSASAAPVMKCYGLRVGEDVLLRLNVTPGPSVPVGELVKSVMSVTSQEQGSATQSLEFITTATGTHVFDANALDSSLTVYRGQTALLPFNIANQGTSGDDYSVTLLSGDPAYKPRISTTDDVFVPAGHSVQGFLAVTAPSGATLGQPSSFSLQMESLGGGGLDRVDFFVTPVADSDIVVSGDPSNTLLIPERGAAQSFIVEAIDLNDGEGTDIQFSFEPNAVPTGWTLTPSSGTATFATVDGTTVAAQEFEITAPLGALGTTRLPIRFDAVTQESPAEIGFVDMTFDLASTSGLEILTPLGVESTITPGSQEVYKIQVRNNGLGGEKVTMSASGVPAGWTVNFNPAEVNLGPLETQTVEVFVKSPITASPKSAAPVVVFATGTSGALAQQTLTTTIGFREVDLTGSSATVFGAPAETISHIFTVTNNGSVEDDLSLTAAVDSASYAGLVDIELFPANLNDMANGTSQDVRMELVIDPSVEPGVTIPVTLTVASIGDNAQSASYTVRTEVLDFKLRDADSDGIQELAVDRDQDSDNGYEEFTEVDFAAGKQSSRVDPRAFFSEEAAEGYTVETVDDDGNTTSRVVYVLDGDEDGRTDHFIDNNGDLLPDHYWDADSNVVSVISIRRDVNGDDIPDLFVNIDSDDDLDAVYDMTTGLWTPLVIRDIDADGQNDYLVDSNGNGEVDEDETVLYGSDGKLLSVQKIDMDGDGKLDEVYDTDGDGRPDQWVPAGSSKSIPITLRDFDGDGVADWAYDADGDGSDDSYYNPVNGEVSMINSGRVFLDNLMEYWYVGAIFLLVAGLFIALLIVTRR